MEDLVKNMEEYRRERRERCSDVLPSIATMQPMADIVQDLFERDGDGDGDIPSMPYHADENVNQEASEQEENEASEMFLSPLSFVGSARSAVLGNIQSICSISSGSSSGSVGSETSPPPQEDAGEEEHEEEHEDAREDAGEDGHSDGEGTIASFCSTSTTASCTTCTSDGCEGWSKGGSEGGSEGDDSNACSDLDLDINDDDRIYDYSQNRINPEDEPAVCKRKNNRDAKKNDSNTADHASAAYVGIKLPGCCVYYCWRF